jgi:hypothetical protein
LIAFYGNCIKERTKNVKVTNEKLIYISNVISVNWSGGNKVFYVQSASQFSFVIESYSLYYRWGNLIFFNQSPIVNEANDGFDASSFSNLNDGVYVYMIKYNNNGKSDKRYFDITILR